MNNKIKIIKKPFLWVLFLSFSFNMPLIADIKCWDNRDGVMECGSIIPLEYRRKKHEIRDESGEVVKTIKRDRTKAEIEQLEKEERRKQIEKIKNKKQAEEDRRLLDLYPTEDDILLARDGQTRRIDEGIRITKSQLVSYKRSLSGLKKQLAAQENKDEANAKKGKASVQRLEDQIVVLYGLIDDKEKAKEKIMQEYNLYLERYREIKQRQKLREKKTNE